MIPKAELLNVAEESGLLATTIEKDYALGWMLFATASHPDLSRWIFKGGTCLKKCYFDTYRFSEDLDFTLPEGVPYEAEAIHRGLRAAGAWVQEATGMEFPEDGTELEQITNKRGQVTFQARMTFRGPLGLARQSRQRIKFDLTRHELLVSGTQERKVFHGYSDSPNPIPTVRCYSLEEILAEKTRALVERSGRARDVFDVVNIGRNFQAEVNVSEARVVASKKFAFKELAEPRTDEILAVIDAEVLATDWDNALRHQLLVLPPANEFHSGLRGVLDWLLTPARVASVLPAVPARAGEELVPRVHFSSQGLGRGAPVLGRGSLPAGAFGSRMDRIRFSARNRLLARIRYHGVDRLVEPYSLRLPRTGNLLLYVHEVERGGSIGGGIKAFKVAELGEVLVTERPFAPQYVVEL